MKVCIPLRDPAPSNLRLGNLRSEGRWERLVLEACTRNPEVTALYTYGYEWQGGSSVSSKYRGKINPNIDDCILLMQDWNKSVFHNQHYKAAIISIFAGPWIEQKTEVFNITQGLNGNLFFTIGYPILYREELFPGVPLSEINKIARTRDPTSHLENFANRDHIKFLPIPGIPESKFQDGFSNKKLIWSCRLIFLSTLEQTPNIQWALKRLETDSELTLDIITGWEPQEVKDLSNGEVIKNVGEINQAFWKLNNMQAYLHLQNRVKVFCSLDWQTLLEKFRQSKILLNHSKLYGGPPLEAAMHGVPFIGTGKTGALGDCEDYLFTGDTQEAFSLLDKLMLDHEFYTKIASSYHDYAIRHYSFEAFNHSLNAILQDNNLL